MSIETDEALFETEKTVEKYIITEHAEASRPVEGQDNHDALLTLPDTGLYGVFDGVGKGWGADIAAKTVAQTLSEQFSEDIDHLTLEDLITEIDAALQISHQKMMDYAEEEGGADIATTATFAFIHKDKLVVASVGDSRAYAQMADDTLKVLTQDSSYAFMKMPDHAALHSTILDFESYMRDCSKRAASDSADPRRYLNSEEMEDLKFLGKALDPELVETTKFTEAEVTELFSLPVHDPISGDQVKFIIERLENFDDSELEIIERVGAIGRDLFLNRNDPALFEKAQAYLSHNCVNGYASEVFTALGVDEYSAKAAAALLDDFEGIPVRLEHIQNLITKRNIVYEGISSTRPQQSRISIHDLNEIKTIVLATDGFYENFTRGELARLLGKYSEKPVGEFVEEAMQFTRNPSRKRLAYGANDDTTVNAFRVSSK